VSEADRAPEHRDSPYVGLDYYQEGLGAWFFGREADGSKIITNLQAARLTLLHAESGVGKSSLLRAGVAWRLGRLARMSSAGDGAVIDIPVVFDSWKDDPVRELVVAIRAAIGPFLAGRPEPELLTDRLDTAIVAAADAVDASLLIILDQFEEYFLYSSREPVPERFADELARCINRADLPANFLIAIREDAYAGLGDLFKGRITNVYGNYLHIDYLDRASAELAIRQPLEVYNGQPGVTAAVKIQDELVEAVLDEVRAYDGASEPAKGPAQAAGTGRVATPLLQLVMERVWERERTQGSRELRHSTLQSLEGVGKIVDTHLWKALRSLGSGERRTAIDMFDHLVTPSGGKIAESVPDLAHRTGRSEEQVGSVLAKLDNARIVRPVPAPPGQDRTRFRRYEIFHDVLAPTISRTIAAREGRRRAFARLRGLGVLTLALLLAAVAALAISLRHTAAIDRSTAAIDRTAAVADRQTAQAAALVAAADANVARDPELSALLALQALRVRDTSQADAALRDALPDLQEVRTIQDRTPVYWAAFDPADAGKVAATGKNGIAGIWNVRTGRRLVRMALPGGLPKTGTGDVVAFSKDGSMAAVGYGGGHVAVYDARTGARIQSTDAKASVTDAQFVGSTGDVALATHNGPRLWLRNGGTNSLVTLSGIPATTIAVDPHNPLEFAVATSSGTDILRQSQPGSSLVPSQPLGPGDEDAEFSPDGKDVVTADSDGKLRVYELSTGKEVMTLDAAEGVPGNAVFSSDGRLIAAGYTSGTARVWDASTGLQLTLLSGNASAINSVRFNPGGSKVVTASDDGTIRVWHAQPRELRAQLASPHSSGTRPSQAYTANYNPAGSRVVAVYASGKAAVFTSAGRPVYHQGRRVVIDPPGGVSSARFNQAGSEIVTAGANSVDRWHAVGSNYTQIQHIPVSKASYAAFSPAGTRVAIVTGEQAQVRSTQTGRLLRKLNPHHHFPLSVAVFSPNGRHVLTGDDNGQVEVWDANKGTELRRLGSAGPVITDVQFNRAGTEFATASDSGIVTIWSASTDRPILLIPACPSPNTASFSPGGGKIVVACGDGTAPVFDAVTGQQLTVLQAANAGTVNDAAFSPHGGSIVTAYGAAGTGGVRIWNSELATALPALEKLAELRVTRKLTPAERKSYLADTSG
jgi:WD40 repeat protein